MRRASAYTPHDLRGLGRSDHHDPLRARSSPAVSAAPFVFVSQATLTRVYEELGILSLTTAILFFWVGQRRTFVANAALAIAFAAACYVVLLAYPALAFFRARSSLSIVARFS